MNRSEFLGDKNESMLNRLVYTDFQRRTSGSLSDKNKTRLVNTVNHYMNEVYNNNPNNNITSMNKEVLGLVVSDFSSYLRRGQISANSDTDARMIEAPLISDVGSRFAALQNERGEQKTLMPPAPDFRIPIEDSNDSPALSLFEQAKKSRESEAKRIEQGEKPTFSGTFLNDLNEGSGIANANPTLAKPEAIRIKPALSQDTIIPQDEILSFKENEYNLVIYSADRDWYNNQRENRYNFSVTFNPANNGQGFKMSTSANMRFHNIVRIEMVKAIVPAESIDVVLANNSSNGAISTKPFAETILSFPSVMMHVDELESNVFGTDDQLDRAFATLQYDAQWLGSTSSALNFPTTTTASAPNSGYYAMIPKFLKCQKTYYPTPLATLTKMTIQLQRPNGSLINESLDTLDISGIFASNTLPAGFGAGTSKYAAVTDGTLSAYYIIRTKTFFNSYSFVPGDVIQVKGINPDFIINNNTARDDWINYIQKSTGLTIVQTGFLASGVTVTDTPNNVNYCNFIVVQNRFNDPTSGSTTVQPFGGTATINNNLETALRNLSLTGARLINVTKQTQLTFRIITRDMDSATRIRPNNT